MKSAFSVWRDSMTAVAVDVNGETVQGRRLLEMIACKDAAATHALLDRIKARRDESVVEVSRSTTDSSDLVILLLPTWMFNVASTQTASGVRYAPDIRLVLERKDKEQLMHEMGSMALSRTKEPWINAFVYAGPSWYFHT